MKKDLKICPLCTGDAFITIEGDKVNINCACCGKNTLTKEEYEFEKETVKQVTGLKI